MVTLSSATTTYAGLVEAAGSTPVAAINAESMMPKGEVAVLVPSAPDEALRRGRPGG